MKQFIEHLPERNFQNRTIAIIENGSWAPAAARTIKKMLENSQNITYAETTVTIKSAMTEENKAELDKLVEELL